ncbi:hypothetical protein [Mangrovicoccus algicola]|uniref:Uncharacterized protein n=1 Tax=Mangrovicoccus algicola TaxID=2771008 RepID=A0A8J6Z6W5_9RHOB|nr:hypothetical protein [Mangrovicoccus algicola]MBE3638994.1 hypothetical protein [Mangrovicoccus algicola]
MVAQQIDRIYALAYIGLAIGFPLLFLLYWRALFYARVIGNAGGFAEYRAALQARADSDPVARMSLGFLKSANLFFLFYWLSAVTVIGSHWMRGWWSG